MKINVLQMNRVLHAALFVLLLSVAGMTKANPVDMNIAREVAVKFINANTKMPLRGTDELQLVATYNISRGDAAFHIFNTQNGFVIVAADDCATPILGYSEEGQFDMDNIPVQLQDYLQGFVEQIQYGIENHLEADEQTARQWELVRTSGWRNENRDGEIVGPLIISAWGQGCHYNAMCPEDEDGPCGHVVTGCTATAMAQVMKYWEWPVQGSGEHSYEWNGQILSANFGETIYDWDNMLDDYRNHPGTQEQEEAVATLMWHCGVSVNMDYSPSGSGAWLNPSSMINYFSYSDEMSLDYRSDFSDASWKAKLKDCLNLGRPLWYVGSNLEETIYHAFVCDGYEQHDMFHFNFGWDSSYDGYFALDAITNGGGILGFDWSYNHSAIFNIHPRDDNPTNYVINVSVNSVEGGAVSGGGIFTHGTNVTLSAIANNGYTFCYWEENGGIASTNPNYSFTANFSRNLVAVFTEPFTVTVSATEGGLVFGGGSFSYGESCTVTAIPDEGYGFANWTKNGNVVSTSANYTFAVTGESDMVAHFVSLEGNIVFADSNVKAICVANWDTNDDGELSYAEAAMVMSIGQVFRGNTGITSFEELQYFINLTSIGNYAFCNCSSLTSLTIPCSVTSIIDYAFCNCNSLTSLTIPCSVTSISGKYVFVNCNALMAVYYTGSIAQWCNISFSEMANNPLYYAHNLYINNELLTELVIPETITEIKQFSFNFATCLTSLSIPNSVTLIGRYAFHGCSSLTGDVIIPNSVILIDRMAFGDCSGLTSVHYTGGIDQWCNIIFQGVDSNPLYYAHNLFINNELVTNLVIPENVTVIGDYAFCGATCLTSLYFSNSVTTIGNYAFEYCNGLRGSLIIGNSVTSIGDYAFYFCPYLGSITLPSSVTSIGRSAFRDSGGFMGIVYYTGSIDQWCNIMFSDYDSNPLHSAHNLFINNELVTNLVIPENVTIIRDFTFYGATCLTSLTLSKSVTIIGNEAFRNCSGLMGSLILTNSVTTIGDGAFAYCNGLMGSLILPNSVTSIGESAFVNCIGLTSLTLPNSVTTIGNNAFNGCRGLNAVYYTGDIHQWCNISFLGNYSNPLCFAHKLFINNELVTDLVFPETVTEIKPYIFCGATCLTSLTLPKYVTLIGNSAFSECINLYTITSLAETPPALGDQTFDSSNTNAFVFVPCGFEDGYASISWGGFSNFYGMCGGTVTVVASPEEGGMVTGSGSFEAGQTCTVTATAQEGYSFINWTQNGVTISNNAECTFYVSGDVIMEAHFLADYNILFADTNVKAICVSHWDTDGDGELSYDEAAAVTNLGDCFKQNTSIASFDELQYFIGLSSICNEAFKNCRGLTSIILPNSITSIGSDAFYACTGMTGPLVIPNSVTTIGSSAFHYCRNLTGSLTIPNSIVSIGINAFYDCNGFNAVYYTGDIQQWCNIQFGNSSSNPLSVVGKLYIGNELVTDLVIPETVTVIKPYVFCGAKYLRSLTIPNSVTSIHTSAFSNCIRLKSLTIPNSVTSIGSSAFRGCSGLTTLNLPNSVITIGSSAFSDCTELTGSLIIPNSVTSIGNDAFYNCSGLTTLTLSNSVITIGNDAFHNCSGLTGSLIIPNAVISIGSGAFGGCSGLEQIVVEDGNTKYDSRNNCNAIIDTNTNELVVGCKNTIIPNSVTSIGRRAFLNCSGLTGSLTIPSSVISIGSGAFDGCNGLTSITIPNSVISIGEWGLYGCSGLTFIAIHAEIPPAAYSTTFYACPKSIPVYVPCGSLEAYQSAEYWNEFTNINELCAFRFITSGIWSDANNWSGGALPGANDDVSIDANCTLNGNAVVASLTVSAGQTLTLQSGKTLTVTGNLTNTAATGLVIEDAAQLRHASENVSATVKKNIAGHGTNAGKYYLISNPLTSVVNPEMSNVYHLVTGNYDLYDWHPSAPDNLEWRNFKDNSYLMSPEGYGYLYANQNGVELIFPGTLKPSNNRYAKSVSYDSSDAEHPGWNLIGNPFVCNVYLVNENNEPLPFYRMNAAGNGFEAVTPGTAIAPMEGVFYKASGNGTVYFIRAN